MVVMFDAANLGRNVGESATVRTGTAFAQAEADLIANSYSRFLAVLITDNIPDDLDVDELLEGDTGGLTVEELIENELEELEEIVEEGDLQHIGVLDRAGNDLWSLGEDPGSHIDADSFERAFEGSTVSFLNRGESAIDHEGQPAAVDLIESYVPFSLDNDETPDAVLHMAKDVTDVLAANITATEESVRKTVFVRIGLLLAILSAFVFVLDLTIARRFRLAMNKERMTRQQLDARNAELQRLDRSKNEFLSNLSHELKTPLAAILGFTRIIKSNKRNVLNETEIKQLGIVDRNGTRLDSLINDLLDLSRIESRKISLEPEETGMKELLRSTLEGMETVIGDRNQSLTHVVDHPELWLEIDPVRMTQVICNLVNNASKYSPGGSTVTVTSMQDGDQWVMTVEDEGMGISETHQDQLFALFYRTPDAHHSAVPGTGIGLYISKQIVDLHGGKIELRSAEGRGTTVTVRIPGVRSAPIESKPRRTGFANTLEALDEAS